MTLYGTNLKYRMIVYWYDHDRGQSFVAKDDRDQGHLFITLTVGAQGLTTYQLHALPVIKVN